MSAGTLPQYIDAPKWADREAVIQEIVPLSVFARVCEGAVSHQGNVSVHCRIYRDSQHLIVLEADLKTVVPLECQRCLDAVETTIDTHMQLWLLYSEEQADRLADDADYLVLDEEGRISLVEVLEDELILSLPLVALHEDCEVQADVAVAAETHEEGVAADKPQRENPFQVLARLKGNIES